MGPLGKDTKTHKPKASSSIGFPLQLDLVELIYYLLFIGTYNAHLQLKTLKWHRTIVMEEA